MYDIFDIMSFYAYDIDAVTEYVDTLSSALPDKASKGDCNVEKI